MSTFLLPSNKARELVMGFDPIGQSPAMNTDQLQTQKGFLGVKCRDAPSVVSCSFVIYYQAVLFDEALQRKCTKVSLTKHYKRSLQLLCYSGSQLTGPGGYGGRRTGLPDGGGAVEAGGETETWMRTRISSGFK